MKKKHTIKIPKNATIFYCSKKRIITVKGPLAQKSLKLKVKIELLNNEKLIKVTSIPFSKISNNQKKNILAIQGTTISLIKQLIVETSYILYKKLKLVGVGYRAFDVENFNDTLLSLKLGHSHPIYFKIPEKSQIFCLKRTKLFVYGNSYQDITQTASFIRSYKKPEPYKGKGILYETEKINLKEGKKV
jgi:large subunit ribosomal protein L6